MTNIYTRMDTKIVIMAADIDSSWRVRVTNNIMPFAVSDSAYPRGVRQ